MEKPRILNTILGVSRGNPKRICPTENAIDFGVMKTRQLRQKRHNWTKCVVKNVSMWEEN